MDEQPEQAEGSFVMTTALYVVGGVLLLFFGMQFFVIWKSKRSKGKKIEGLKGQIGKSVANSGRVLAYFYSPSCAACRTQTPVVEKLQSEFSNVFKVNVADDLDTARAFGVMATPTTAIVNGGIVEELLIGAKTEKELRSYLH